MISVPIACPHGKSEDALKNFLSQIEYGLYAEAKLRKPQVGGAVVNVGSLSITPRGRLFLLPTDLLCKFKIIFFGHSITLQTRKRYLKKLQYPVTEI